MGEPTEYLVLSEIEWSDIELKGMAWIHDGRDLVLNLKFPNISNIRTMQAEWAHTLNINMSFAKNVGGLPMTWDVKIEEETAGVLLVVFDFASRGELHFRCSSVKLFDEHK